MRTIIGYLICICFFGITGDLSGQVHSETRMVTVTVETIQDKIRGGLLGQIIGDLNGQPHEDQYIDGPGNVKNYIPSLSDGAWTDDDTDFEWFYITIVR